MLTLRLFKTASFRLSAFHSAVIVVCFAVLLLITYWTATAALREQLRVDVRNEIQTMTIEAGTDGVDGITQDIDELTSRPNKPEKYYYLSDGAGRKLAGNLVRIERREGWQELDLNGATTAVPPPDATDDDHSLWGEGVLLPGGSFLFVGEDAFRVLSAQEAIVQSFLWSAGVALVLAILAGLVLSQSFLKRIDAINLTSRAIMDGNLKQRIPVKGTSDEIDRLSLNLNRLFDSNQSLLASLKQVSTSIAHDLRTPLSRLRQGLEEAKLKPASRRAHGDAIDAAIVEANQLLATFSALLRIAQIESGSRKAAFKNLDLTELFERVALAYRAVAEDEGKEFVTALTPGIKYYGDSDLLIQVIANLLENAIRHTPPRTRIWITLQQDGKDAVATVADSGPGIPADSREKVFEHFYRLDTSRSSPGNGLGLSLVSAVVALHGITIKLSDNRPGLKVTLIFTAPQ